MEKEKLFIKEVPVSLSPLIGTIAEGVGCTFVFQYTMSDVEPDI
jgi:hypothetical protein